MVFILFKLSYSLTSVYYLFFDICFTPLLIAYTRESACSCLPGQTFVADYCFAVEILPYGIRARGFALMVRFCPSFHLRFC
jgi:hypothetical protein